ncbi:mitochondrial carrier domain-containing protein [Blyttiomyces helicus]|uniref:Mitochondrial carrier domain-containing protein n=1 Tax=Blyttiomyces helicus TaxID=388810 RepID=A0A4P9W9B7_9FUNG|nr:mitochondrial carrier domain-containing protein [Blyttiomyces helicus]|eukprot:RKO86796.1 mitochondrial carrier domain-containing protein [Blyttiomyces helicus]
MHPLAATCNDPDSPPPLLADNFFAGGIALATSFAVMHPLDTLKTRMQAAETSAGSARPGLNVRSVLNRETARALGKGFIASVMGAGPQGGLRLSTYEFAKTHLLAPSSKSTSTSPSLLPTFGPITASALSAIAGDFVSSIVKVPREVITARLQTAHYGANTGASYAFRAIIRDEGARGLFRGFWSTTARDWPFMVILFTTYETFKQFHNQNLAPAPTSVSAKVDASIHEEEIDEVPIATLKSTMFGGMSGALAGFLTTPFDVVKTRIMTAKGAAGATPLSMAQIASGMVEARRRALVAGGSAPGLMRPYAVFFTGAVARSTWW